MKKLTSLDGIKKVIGDDTQSLKEFTEAFISQTSMQLNQLQDCLQKNDAAEIKNVVHKMKSSISYFGMNDQVVLAQQIEETITKEFEKTKPMVNELISICQIALDELRVTAKEMN